MPPNKQYSPKKQPWAKFVPPDPLIGHTMMIVGMSKKFNLNGQLASVESFDRVKGRCNCRVRGKMVALKREHLQVMEPAYEMPKPKLQAPKLFHQPAPKQLPKDQDKYHPPAPKPNPYAATFHPAHHPKPKKEHHYAAPAPAKPKPKPFHQKPAAPPPQHAHHGHPHTGKAAPKQTRKLAINALMQKAGGMERTPSGTNVRAKAEEACDSPLARTKSNNVDISMAWDHLKAHLYKDIHKIISIVTAENLESAIIAHGHGALHPTGQLVPIPEGVPSFVRLGGVLMLFTRSMTRLRGQSLARSLCWQV